MKHIILSYNIIALNAPNVKFFVENGIIGSAGGDNQTSAVIISAQPERVMRIPAGTKTQSPRFILKQPSA